MEYKQQPASSAKFQPRLVIHGGAGNIVRRGFPEERYQAFRTSLIRIVRALTQLLYHISQVSNTKPQVTSTRDYMNTPITDSKRPDGIFSPPRQPNALEIATHAVIQLENDPLFNSGHGAVFTRDGINQLEASVMVSRGYKKRGVGVMGLRHVRNPIVLAKRMLEHGEQDLAAKTEIEPQGVDAPSAQGHTQLYGEAAEVLARQYGCEMVSPNYFFTQQRWDEHVKALEKEKKGTVASATWDEKEYLPQGTCGAVAMDEDGVICAATSTGGLTNKLTGRVGDTPVPGAGFWAGEWDEAGDPTRGMPAGISFAGPLQGLFADCLPTPWMYAPAGDATVSRAVGVSGTGNGDSFLRICAGHSVAARAQWKPESGAQALSGVAGPKGELQRSAGDRFGKTGEGEGGMIGIESVVVRDSNGNVVGTRSDILMDYNCGGMYRAWVDDDDKVVMSIWTNGGTDPYHGTPP